MSSEFTKPKPEDAMNKPKVTVAAVKPNIHRIEADQENDEHQSPGDDAVLKKRRLSPAMLKRSLTKVKEIDSEDYHLDVPDADEDDPKGEKVPSKKNEDADEEGSKREQDESSEKEDSNEENTRRSKVESKKTEDSDEEVLKESMVDSKKTEDIDGAVVPYDAHGKILHRGKKKKSPPVSLSDHESEDHPNHQHHRSGWIIRKDDEFFHFIIACFAIGAVLVCEHSYGDWTISAGIGLLVFASLETIGIYFGFVTRIRAVLEGFLPLFQRSALPGFSKRT
ncbi:transmembrane protein 40-like isoform X5 [Pleurodeles waltl]|uniref:transmembrane protein 40-like isoform X5 n=1 Tax=Pleurodeles waltl TaxID=8319 RepID=UPI003709A046